MFASSKKRCLLINYVLKQTPEIYFEAIKQNKNCLKYINVSKFNINIEIENKKINQSNQMIYYQNLIDNTMEYIIDEIDILKLVIEQIKNQYGEIMKNKAIDFYKLHNDKEKILNDNSFQE